MSRSEKNSRHLELKFLVLRLFIGGFFVMVGTDKVLSPYQNFLYVVQAYQIFPDVIETIVAIVFPWIELLLGLFLLLGLWLNWVLRVFLLTISAFILIISQALVRKLEIHDCGCFGGLFSSDIRHTLLIDICLWILVGLMLKMLDKASFCSLDRYFAKQKN